MTSPCRVAGSQQSDQAGLAVLVETLVGHHQQLAGPIQRIVLVASVAEDLLLDPTADLVEVLPGQLVQMKRAGDLDRVGRGCQKVCVSDVA